MIELEQLLQDICARVSREKDRGKVADYIPALREIDPEKFGIAIAFPDGRQITAGDCDEAFSIQSISKLFTLALSLGQSGDAIWRRVGREPSGNAFNSIVQLEYEKGIPRNPFINAGALAVTDMLLSGHEPREAIGHIMRFIRFLADDDSIIIDHEVVESERAVSDRNLALAHYMRSHGNLIHSPEKVLGVYIHHCAIAMTCRQLATAGLFLANGGRHQKSGHSVISTLRARRINALMLTCGLYDSSGEFAFRVGIPSKSGVGGGILAVVPSVASIAIWSPGLDQSGNSLLGIMALEELAHSLNWSVFADRPLTVPTSN